MPHNVKTEYILIPVFDGIVKIRGNNSHLQAALGTTGARLRLTEFLERLSLEESDRQREEAAQVAEAAAVAATVATAAAELRYKGRTCCRGDNVINQDTAREVFQRIPSSSDTAEEFELVNVLSPKPLHLPDLLLPEAICLSLSRAIRARSYQGGPIARIRAAYQRGLDTRALVEAQGFGYMPPTQRPIVPIFVVLAAENYRGDAFWTSDAAIAEPFLRSGIGGQCASQTETVAFLRALGRSQLPELRL